MKLLLAITYIVVLALYIVSHAFELPDILIEFRLYSEKVALYCFLVSLTILSVSEILSRWLRKGRRTSSEIMSENLKAHIYTTRVVIALVVVGFPVFVYFNWSRAWGISDAVIVAIPTILLAIVLAEQNVYTYLSSRLERIGIEQARITSVYQVVDTMVKDPTRKGMPDKEDLDELRHSLKLWEDRTAEANFAKFAAQARNTLRSIERNSAEAIWDDYLKRIHRDLGEYVRSYT
ncbi:hypothetical protein [Idiomarina loihiensis]|uniref:hypothetical protein n=1 Tax=Idiomarina loihiensis TaxID=135577 RepID=UPI00384B6C81